MKKKIVVGVSGGADSMFLLYLLNKKKKNISVAHVNYNFRKESINETKLVKKFCVDNNIEFNLLDVDDKIIDKYKMYSNKQQMAREIRYDFYKKIAKKNNTNLIYIAHHKDDFIETAIMQEEKSDNLPFYGIEKNTNLSSFQIIRPLLTWYKNEIIAECNKKNIPFLHDKSNFDVKYRRNRIRANLLKKNNKEKNKIFSHYKKINKSREGLRKNIEKKWIDFQSSDFDREYLIKLDNEMKYHMIYKLLINSSPYIKINKNKILGSIEFIENKKGGTYRLMNDVQLSIKDSKIKVYIK